MLGLDQKTRILVTMCKMRIKPYCLLILGIRKELNERSMEKDLFIIRHSENMRHIFINFSYSYVQRACLYRREKSQTCTEFWLIKF